MEEILASIRRIIADDDASKAVKPPDQAAAKPPPAAAVPRRPAPPPRAPGLPPAPPPPAIANSQDDIDAMLANLDKPAAAPASEVLDLTEAMAAPAPDADVGPAVTFRTIDAASDVIFTDRAPDPPAEPAVRIIEEPHRPAAPAQPVTPITPAPAPALDRALISTSTVAAVDSAFNSLAHTVIGQNARTLEDLVKEMLRPLLKSWLDDNLPGLVDRIVRAEIERVSRGRP
jgi:cell pole-organizing protein PopZ